MRSIFGSVLIYVVFLIALFQEGFSLRCHICYSEKSWDDCLKHTQEIPCDDKNTDDSSYACMTTYTARQGTNNQQFDQFAKSCFLKDLCNKESCLAGLVNPKDRNITKGIYCEVECCFEDGCNKGTTRSNARSSTISTMTKADGVSSTFVYTMIIFAWSSVAE